MSWQAALSSSAWQAGLDDARARCKHLTRPCEAGHAQQRCEYYSPPPELATEPGATAKAPSSSCFMSSPPNSVMMHDGSLACMHACMQMHVMYTHAWTILVLVQQLLCHAMVLRSVSDLSLMSGRSCPPAAARSTCMTATALHWQWCMHALQQPRLYGCMSTTANTDLHAAPAHTQAGASVACAGDGTARTATSPAMLCCLTCCVALSSTIHGLCKVHWMAQAAFHDESASIATPSSLTRPCHSCTPSCAARRCATISLCTLLCAAAVQAPAQVAPVLAAAALQAPLNLWDAFCDCAFCGGSAEALCALQLHCNLQHHSATSAGAITASTGCQLVASRPCARVPAHAAGMW